MDFFGFCTPSQSNSMRPTQKEIAAKSRDCDVLGCCTPANMTTSMVNAEGNKRYSLMDESAEKAARQERVGVGLILALDSGGSMFIHTVCPGSSADGRLLCGDVLVQVGTVDVTSLPAPYVAALLLGAPGTEIEVVVRRPSEGNAGYRVKLVRRRTDPENVKKAIDQSFTGSQTNTPRQ
uniref:PDZ domain-containing protein n=1 Tax=Cryptomonas curvata TaxID=233186 RepID=A0A7S0QBH0_9CRYP